MDVEEIAAGYERVARDLETAAAHARTAARHLRDGERARGPAHAFSVVGHVRRAQDTLDRLARLHAERSVPLPETLEA